ncbi:hypothetical protein [Siphonobacter sp. SORGH_AS_0500]|uniref:hypothetical protein n=1 Tax=Siphonobacter sp. SORGH_AS_0500 TaxID=1864824 RepID=UPI0028557498|nr:hypothetical protein [Siphonobacter sp. SORGH_AS_0500]MDR6194732.1 hypothetical protein [Siphonobacter sp. SORGH_AS_0500]
MPCVPAPKRFPDFRDFLKQNGIKPSSLASLLDYYLSLPETSPHELRDDWMEHFEQVEYRRVIEDFRSFLFTSKEQEEEELLSEADFIAQIHFLADRGDID